MEKRYTVRQAVTMTGVKSYVMRYWEEELDLHIGRNELGHRYYTPYDIQLFLKINELKSRGLQLKAIKTLIPKIMGDAPGAEPSDVRILEGEAVEVTDVPLEEPETYETEHSHISEKLKAEDSESGDLKKSDQKAVEDEKILEFQEILERLIHEEMQRKKEGEYRCRSLDEAIRRQQQARREAAASAERKKNKKNKKGCR